MSDRHSPTTQDKIAALLDRFPQARDRLDLVVEVGSTAHNISAGADDLDLTVVWTEQFEDLMSLDPAWSTKMLRTQPEGARSGPGDIDMQVYSMRKFVSLCVAGNPSILNTLFIPEDMVLYERPGRMGVTLEPAWFPREALAALSHTRSAGRAFLGYMDSQLKRWDDGTIERRVSRPEEVEKYGYAVKYVAHAIRLGIQGSEFLTTGRVTIPMAEEHGARLRALRRGEMTEPDAREWARAVHERLRLDLESSDLPKGPDYPKVHRFLADWHRERL